MCHFILFYHKYSDIFVKFAKKILQNTDKDVEWYYDMFFLKYIIFNQTPLLEFILYSKIKVAVWFLHKNIFLR